MKYSFIILLLLLFSFGCNSSESLSNSQSIHLSTVGNARELGGYITNDGKKIKHKTLLRTAALNKISSEDVKHLTDVYHLATIADLRMSFEIASKPDPIIEGVKYINLRVIDEELYGQELEKKLSFEGDAFERLKLTIESGLVSYDVYVRFLSSNFGKKAYSEFFRELLELPEGRSILFHCTQGKDRTGCAAMLILAALGVNEQTIMEDYLLTNIFNADSIASQKKWLSSYGLSDSELEKYMIVLDEVNPKVMNTLLSWLKENYGSTVGYIINELGVSTDEIETLKSKFLEE